MPKGIYKRKITQGFKSGNIPWNKDGHMPKGFGEKIRDRNIKMGIIPPNPTGRIFTENTKNKIRLKHLGKSKMGIRGEKHPRWNGGITPENVKIRTSVEMRLWREGVFARDNYTCQKTKERGVYLVAHHIKNFSQFPELRTSISNGITLSKKAHQEFHKKYGIKNNTPEQLIEFLHAK